MSLKTVLAMALLGALAVATAPAAAQGPPRAATPARAAQLDAIVAFFVPARRLAEIMIEGTTAAYRTRLDTHEDHRALEAAFPGIREVMAAAAAAAIRRIAPDQIARLQREVRSYWDARLTDADAAALGAFASHPSVTGPLETEIGFRPGDTATAGAARNRAALERARVFEQFERHQAAFARTPAGQRLGPAIAAYQRALQERTSEAARAAAMQMLAAAHQAANDFARQRYPGRPLPYDD